jgi:thiol-disulfide isomerase/thioredoxin
MGNEINNVKWPSTAGEIRADFSDAYESDAVCKLEPQDSYTTQSGAKEAGNAPRTFETISELRQAIESLRPGQYAVVLFSAEWCGWCKEYEPHFEEMALEAGGRYLFLETTREEATDEYNAEMADESGRIDGFPKVVIFDRDGNAHIVSNRMDPFEEIDLVSATSAERLAMLRERLGDTDSKIRLDSVRMLCDTIEDSADLDFDLVDEMAEVLRSEFDDSVYGGFAGYIFATGFLPLLDVRLQYADDETKESINEWFRGHVGLFEEYLASVNEYYLDVDYSLSPLWDVDFVGSLLAPEDEIKLLSSVEALSGNADPRVALPAATAFLNITHDIAARLAQDTSSLTELSEGIDDSEAREVLSEIAEAYAASPDCVSDVAGKMEKLRGLFMHPDGDVRRLAMILYIIHAKLLSATAAAREAATLRRTLIGQQDREILRMSAREFGDISDFLDLRGSSENSVRFSEGNFASAVRWTAITADIELVEASGDNRLMDRERHALWELRGDSPEVVSSAIDAFLTSGHPLPR